MTPIPHLHALAMRTKAAGVVYPTLLDTALSRDLEATILALPLEADHAALLAEAVKVLRHAAENDWNAANHLPFVSMHKSVQRRLIDAQIDAALSALETP